MAYHHSLSYSCSVLQFIKHVLTQLPTWTSQACCRLHWNGFATACPASRGPSLSYYRHLAINQGGGWGVSKKINFRTEKLHFSKLGLWWWPSQSSQHKGEEVSERILCSILQFQRHAISCYPQSWHSDISVTPQITLKPTFLFSRPNPQEMPETLVLSQGWG